MSLVTPIHFSAVQPNFYRGSYPREINIPFLRTLRLKYILSLTPEPLTHQEPIAAFCRNERIQMVHIECGTSKKSKNDGTKLKRKKKPVPIEYNVVVRCVQFLTDKRHYPCYMHCTNGELVTSLVVACLRKLSYWSTVSIFNEYLTYATNINIHERQFIENFNLEIEINDLKISDKVAWISNRAADTRVDEENGRIKLVGSIPDTLPKLRFHSI
ncbi:LAMI_0H12486g1_1 [Lachancea mirantina]|uniref:LAMI_0H12486g1_1 n=1 Tax=Lachancea mirantina TaxID=1230905 RepID=A0A1G4KHD9_9SACH|nr:LAMI_0H12486g1_1 [Lachancea mirantina]